MKNPAGVEAQFLWTERHVASGKTCTIVTTRHSGGSYLNTVELQNGCLALAHSHLYIPSTLNGNNFNEKGLDTGKLRENMNAATDVYIDRVNGAPCGDTDIKLLKGANDVYSVHLQERRPQLLTFLNGSAKAKKQLENTHPTQFKYFNEIWQVRNAHMVKTVAEKYVFLLVPCYKNDCLHPVCKRGKPEKDVARKCTKCPGACAGHYLPLQECFQHIEKHGTK